MRVLLDEPGSRVVAGSLPIPGPLGPVVPVDIVVHGLSGRGFAVVEILTAWPQSRPGLDLCGAPGLPLVVRCGEPQRVPGLPNPIGFELVLLAVTLEPAPDPDLAALRSTEARNREMREEFIRVFGPDLRGHG